MKRVEEESLVIRKQKPTAKHGGGVIMLCKHFLYDDKEIT